MIDIWVKLVSDQFELAMNLTRQFFGLGAGEAPVSMDPVAAEAPDQADAPAANREMAEASPIAAIMTFLESSDRGATVREIAEHLEMDKRNLLPILKTLVKEKRLDELLGRYCVVKTGGS